VLKFIVRHKIWGIIMNYSELAEAVKNGDNILAVSLAQDLLQSGATIEVIIENGLTDPLNELSSKCTTDDFSLFEIMMAGRAMMDVMELINKELLEENCISHKGKIILGTIKGDIHDLGKHIVNIIFTLSGFKVIDLGKDIEPKKFINAAQEHKTPFICISSLLTPTAIYAREIKDIAKKQNLNDIIVLAGGVGFEHASKEYLQVDYVAKNVFDGLEYILSIVEGKRDG